MISSIKYSAVIIGIMSLLVGFLCVNNAISKDTKSPRPLPSELPGITMPQSLAPGYCPSYGGSHTYEYIESISCSMKEEGVLSINVIIYIANPTGCVYGEPCPEYDNSPEYVNAWIDWNGNKVFESNEKVLDVNLTGYLGINYQGTMSASTIVSVPADAVSSTWIRANLGWDHDPNDACEESWVWGDVVNKEIEIEDIFAKKWKIINELESYGLDESNSKTLLKSLEAQAEQQGDVSEEIKYKVERMILGEMCTSSAVQEGVALSNFMGKATIGCIWSALFVPDLIELALDLNWVENEMQKAILQKQKEVAESLKLGIAKSFGMEGEDIKNWENVIYDSLEAYYDLPSMALELIKNFRQDLENSYAANIKDEYLNTNDMPLIPLPLFQFIKAPTIREGVNKLNNRIKQNQITGSNAEAEAVAVVCKNDVESFANGYRAVAESIYYLVDFGIIDDITSNILGEMAGEKVGPIFKEGIKQLLKNAGNIGKNASKALYPLTVGGKALSAGFGLQGLSTTALIHKVYQVYLFNADTSFTSWWDIITDPAGSNLEISTKILQAKQSADNLTEDLDELYNFLISESSLLSASSIENIPVIEEYLNTSAKAVEDASNVLMAFEDVTGLCVSPEDYNQTKSSLNNAMIDMAIDVFELDSDLYTYFEQLENKNVLQSDDILSQINKTRESASSVKNSLSTTENIIRLWIPTVNKIVPVAEVGTKVPIEFNLYNIGTLQASNISVEMALPAGVNATQATWNIADLASGENATLHTEITFNKTEDFVMEILASDSKSHNAVSSIYVDIVSIPSANLTGAFSDYGVDTDADSLYNQLAIDIGVNVETEGTCVINAELQDTDGSEILETKESQFLATGNNSIILNFNGFGIFKHKLNGPYNIIIKLEDNDGNILDSEMYNTSVAYLYNQFQHLVALTGNYSDYGTDSNSDGVLDYLTVDAEVILVNSGYCVIKGRLTDTTGEEIDWAETATTYLEAVQPQKIKLNFEGKAIYNHGVDGPYYLKDVYIYHTGDINQPDYLHEAYTTNTYRYVQFGSIQPGDANGDGSINVQDVICIINVILDTGTASGSPDCNSDGSVNVQDVICVINKILGG